jgi:hypothetical protein
LQIKPIFKFLNFKEYKPILKDVIIKNNKNKRAPVKLRFFYCVCK